MRLRKVWDAPGRIIIAAGENPSAAVLQPAAAACIIIMKNDEPTPKALLGGFADLCYSPAAHHGRSAIVMDSRSGKMFRELPHALEELRCRHIPYRILFLEASAEVLLRRYKETRRRHPLLDECDGCLEDAIREERRLLKPIRDAADYIIDTTSLSPSQLRGRIVTIFEGETTPMLISCQSFGFRNGLPQDADLVFDVRCLPNPYYVPELKEHDGTEGPVRDYVMNAPESHEMLQKLEELLAFSIPLYQREGKSQLVVAVGCTAAWPSPASWPPTYGA